MKIVSLIATLAVLVTGSDLLRAGVPLAEIDKVYGMIQQPYQPGDCGDSLIFAQGEMYRNVPSWAEADVIAELIERGAKAKNLDVVYNALMLASRIDGQPKWTSRLASAVVAQAASDNVGVSYSAVQLSLKHPNIPHSSEVLAAARKLIDRMEEYFRARILSALGDFPGDEAAQIRREYIKAHISDPDRYESVESAGPHRFNAADSKRADDFNHIFDDQKPKPPGTYPIREYLSYVAKHMSDPDYSFSVMTAEDIADMVDGKLHRDRPEFKEVEDAVEKNAAVISKYGQYVGTLDVGPWLNATAQAADPVIDRRGAFQFRIRGETTNILRASFQIAQGKAQLIKIEQIAADNTAHPLWSAGQ